MDYDGRFIMQKAVGWSLLNDGMTIICDEVYMARQNRCKHHSALALRSVPMSAGALLRARDESIIIPHSSSARFLSKGSKNYHRIIHKNNPHFNRKKFQFEFQNGEVLGLRLYEHLKV